jgi:pimeloyl-ACP methyl ester carboxylesterase
LGAVALHERRCPGTTLVVVERCGHLSTMERPDEVSAALRRWLVG